MNVYDVNPAGVKYTTQVEYTLNSKLVTDKIVQEYNLHKNNRSKSRLVKHSRATRVKFTEALCVLRLGKYGLKITAKYG